jgi:TPR repeat protein
MNNLGYMYEKGQGVSVNYNDAVKWYKMAAGCGDAFAMNNLARMYHDGRGVKRNYQYAYAWAALALERASSKAEKDKYYPLAHHTRQELDSKGFQRAKQLKDELSKSIRVLSE